MALNEQEILRGVNQKDLKAWETLYASYYAALCSYNSDRTFPDIKELTWYLYRSTYNNALFHLRTQASRQNILRKMVAEEVELPDEQFALTVREELIRQLYVYIEDLPEERKKILLMSIQGHSGNEIADLLGISINTVKTQKNRGFKYLREKLKDSVLLFLL
ncbi:MAG: RNA polymerase subunit sigma-70 [Odoribacter sp. 43_10]|nr:MAG: RNA polymerase subunit sigma-70 [Odoribacter sp. 43_10]